MVTKRIKTKNDVWKTDDNSVLLETIPRPTAKHEGLAEITKRVLNFG